jgi:glycosyltransferase involved in cell wall biosynthesis
VADQGLHILLADAHSHGGGQVTYVTSLARELARMGHRVTIACRPGSVLVDAGKAAGAEVLPEFQFRGGVRLMGLAHDLSAARRFLRAHKPDIVHVNGSQDHWTFAVANGRARARQTLIRTRHNTNTVSPNLPNRRLNRHWTHYQIVVCDVVRKDLAMQRTFDARRMVTVHNGVDAEVFQPDVIARSRIREEFGFEDQHIVLGIAARLVHAKGHTYFFKAAAQLAKSFPDMRLLVLGRGPLEGELKQLVVTLGIVGITRFAGFRDDVAQCITAFDVGVQPSVDCDTSSFSLKEQMAAEIPVIASDYGGLKEIVSDGVEGFIVPANTVVPLASAIRRLMDSSELRRRMGVAGRRRVLREFTVQTFAGRTLKVYEKALKMRRERTPY